MRVTWLLFSNVITTPDPLLCALVWSLLTHAIFPTIWQPDMAPLTWLAIPAIGITLAVRPEKRQHCFQNPPLNDPQVGCGRWDRGSVSGERPFSFSCEHKWAPGFQAPVAGAEFQGQQPGRDEGGEIWETKESKDHTGILPGLSCLQLKTQLR